MSDKNIVTVDLGGTNILSALIDSRNNIVDRIKIPTEVEKGEESIFGGMAESIKKLLDNNNVKEEDLKAIAIGVPGTVDLKSGVIKNAPNLNIKNFNVKKSLSKYFNVPIIIENDVNLAALGIQTFELENKFNNILVVFVGTGIGGGLIFNGKLYRGSSYFAGEIGHMKVHSNGRFNGKPSKQTFEGIASRTAIAKAIKKALKKNPDVESELRGKKKIKSKALAKAIKNNDKIAKEEIAKASKVIGTVLGSIVTLLNLDAIVLGGGVLEAMSEFMLPKIEKAFYKAVLEEPGKVVKIFVTKLGDDAPLYGGIPLVNEFLKS